MSLIIAAPASSAARATSRFHVSTETGTPSAASAATSGTTRAISTSGGVVAVYVTPDSPPTSMMSAPAATSCRACSSWASSVRSRTASEKESGPALTMPMSSGRPGTGVEDVVAQADERRRGHGTGT